MANPRVVNGKIRATCSMCKKEFPREQMLASLTCCKPCWRSYMRFRRYGISQEEYEALLVKQGNVCAICGDHNVVLKKNGNHTNGLAVDHVGKRVRGLLCGRCNRGLGYFRDDPSLLSKAARYVVGWTG